MRDTIRIALVAVAVASGSLTAASAQDACSDRDRQSGCRNFGGSAADFRGQNNGNDNTIDLKGGKRVPVTKCDSSGCYTEYVNAPANAQPKTRDTSLRDEIRAIIKAIDVLRRGHVSAEDAVKALHDSGFSDERIRSAMRGYPGDASAAAAGGSGGNCKRLFVGTWRYPGGTTDVLSNGTAKPHCPNCVPTQYWSCKGTTYTFYNEGAPGMTWSAELVAGQLVGPGGPSTRVR